MPLGMRATTLAGRGFSNGMFSGALGPALPTPGAAPHRCPGLQRCVKMRAITADSRMTTIRPGSAARPRSVLDLRCPLSGPRLAILRVVQGAVAHRLDLDRINIREVLDLQFAPHFGIRMWQVGQRNVLAEGRAEGDIQNAWFRRRVLGGSQGLRTRPRR